MDEIGQQQKRALKRKLQMEQLNEFRPFWQLVGECAGGGKMTFLADDEYWKTACAPWNCTKLDCGCRVDSLSRVELARYVEGGCPDDPAAIELLNVWGWK